MAVITINPVTRISGFMEIQAEVENEKIVNVKTGGMFFRGFEKMLKGRAPLDAVYFTERICGICSTAHAMGSTLALENILNIFPDKNDRMIRDFMCGCDFLQNHLRQIYQFTFPDFVLLPNLEPVFSVENYKLSENANQELANHYKESFQYSRYAHEMLAVLGGKAPHAHGIFVGGITVNMDAAKYIKVKSLLAAIKDFVISRMIPDIYTIAEYYPEYYQMGGGYDNLLTYGLFDTYDEEELFYVGPQVMIDGQIQEFNADKITENIHYAWFEANQAEHTARGSEVEQNPQKKDAYSWIKAPRYEGHPMEVGPLARLWFSGDYRRGISAMDRIISRVLETKKIITKMENMLEQIIPKNSNQSRYDLSAPAKGQGLIDTTRGSLGHWTSIADNKIENYDIITPSGWNLSPEDSNGVKGVLEEALMNTYIRDPANPIEIGIIARSFDPCVSCATHVVSDKYAPVDIRIV